MNQKTNQKLLFAKCIVQTAMIICGLFVHLFFSNGVFAQGNLVIMPQRVMFEGTKTSEQLNLANIGKDTVTFAISMLQLRMMEDGRFETINQPDSGQYFADKNLRIFPRRVTLAPNESQIVKVQLTGQNELQPGEYRSHLYFRAVPKAKPLGDQEGVADSSLSVQLVPVFGISIPAIIRVGQYNSKASIEDASLSFPEDTIPIAEFTFCREGNMSVYGDVLVDYIAVNGKVTRVGFVKGLAIYTPNTQRYFRMLLDRPSGVDYNAGILHIRYADQTGLKPVVLVEADIPL
jgi:hypothetical protein